MTEYQFTQLDFDWNHKDSAYLRNIRHFGRENKISEIYALFGDEVSYEDMVMH
jgi:hypothetical protein